MSDVTVGSAPEAPAVLAPATRNEGRGKSALIMAIIVISLSVLASIAIGLFATTIYHYRETITSGGQSTTQYGFNVSAAPTPAGLQILFGSILGIWALVFGIIATVQNRGRKYGIAAMIIAVVAPVLSAIVFSIVGGVTGHNVYNY